MAENLKDKVQPKVEKPKDKEYTIEVIKDYYGKIDPFYLSQKDPEYEYRFLRDEFKNLSMKTGNLLLQKGGWQLAGRNLLKRLGIQDRFIAPDGLYRVGDTVLAFMPKKLFKEKEAMKLKEANEPIDAVKRLVKKGDPRTGGSEMHSTMKGIQTKEALKGNWK